jgi:hypothetical protein
LSAVSHVPLAFAALRRRILLLLAFAAALLGVAASARLLSAGAGHAELDRIFELGGPTLGAGYIVFGWIVGRAPLIATLVLLAGLFSQDRATGLARVLAARPNSLLAIYSVRFVALALAAFLFSATLLPLFDLLLLGRWAGASTWLLAAAYVIAYAGLVALLSVFTRADAWIALLLAFLAVAWNALRGAGLLDAIPAGGRQFVTLILPPHGSLLAIENAFGQAAALPWNAFLDVCIYGLMTTILAALALSRREI